MFLAPSLLQGKPGHCSEPEGAVGSLQRVEFSEAARNATAKQRSPNQQQLAREEDGLRVG